MVGDVSVATISAQPARVGTCDLCARAEVTLAAAVVTRSSAGAAVSFSTCDYCVRALRRLAATTDSPVRFVDGGPGTRVVGSDSTLVEVVVPQTAEIIHEYPTPVQDGRGVLYRACAYGAQRADGTWVGWIEFLTLDGATRLRTNQETSQPDRSAVAYWAAGLQSSYLEGAFGRAVRPHVVRLG